MGADACIAATADASAAACGSSVGRDRSRRRRGRRAAHRWWSRALLGLLLALLSVGCEPGAKFASRAQTWGELRAVRGEVTVAAPNERARALFPRERLVDGAAIEVPSEGLAWLRRDGGATLLVRGPASLVFRATALEVKQGRLFVDSPGDAATIVSTRQGRLNLVRVRASLEAASDGRATEAYVLGGEIRTERGSRAGAGERLLVQGEGEGAKATVEPALAWVDWTGGLATTDRTAEPAPFGVGTVGARPAGAEGAPRAPLAIQRMDVRVTIDGDLATTEVDELFFNGASDTVEGIYTFRTPEGAMLTRFGVDREGVVVWGRVKERAAAAAQYRANVYQGSSEDPALLEWDAPGVYRARLYPIAPGEVRRVVVRYTEWLSRSGAHGERRLYLFPMAAEGAEESLPHIEFFRATFDLARAVAREVRVGMQGEQEGQRVVVRAHDLVPRADLALELFGAAASAPSAFRATHQLDPEMIPPAARGAAAADARGEADYVLVPLRAADIPRPAGGLDLVIVVDTSAATDPASLAIARAAVGALLAHMGSKDRAMVWAGDVSLRPVAAGWSALRPVDDELRRAAAVGLATAERGGATDLGALLGEAATQLDPARRGAVVYVGDGRPTVGELALSDLRERLSKLPRPVRIFGLGVGQDADLGLLQGVARAGFAERLGDAASATRAALRLLETAERAAWLGVSVDLGPTVERIYPRDLGALVADETVLLVGRVAGDLPRQLELSTPAGKKVLPLTGRRIIDQGDLRARWASGRLQQMLGEGAGRAALVDLGVRSGIITPYTSFYVPTAKEMTSDERLELERKKQRPRTTLLDESPSERLASTSLGLGPLGCAKYERSQHSDEEAKTKEEKQERELRAASSDAAPAPAQGVTTDQDATTKNRHLNAKLPTEPAKSELAPTGGSEGKAADKLKSATGGEPAATATTTPPGDDSRARGPGAPAGLPAANDATAPWGRDDSGAAPRAAASAAQNAASAAPKGDTWNGEGEHAGAEKQGDLRNAAEFGMIGLLSDGNGPQPDRALEAYGEDREGDLGGIGAIGSGEGGGGRGTGQGFGSGHGRLGASHSATAPQVRMGATKIEGRLPPEVVQRIVRQNFGRFRLCYEAGLRSNPNLQGRVAVRFIIQRDGGVTAVNGGGDLPDAAVVRCVASAFNGLTFPQPEGGLVTVEYPIAFTPGVVAPGGALDRSRVELRVVIDGLPHWPAPCSAGASLPFEDRVVLWRERLAGASGNPGLVARQYARAIASCEAPSWRERSRLLSLMLAALPTIQARVALWRIMQSWSAEADFLYRGILGGVRTPDEMRQLHAALGLRAMDPGALEKLLGDIQEPKERVKKLRTLAVQWPDDFNVALHLLDALEDATDDAGARELARQLRARPDADAHVRTEIGELYLRLAKRADSKERAALDEAEARRSFGEIVEYAPEEPTARRLLGDLLRAHGWYAEAARQYETLARLAPDDAGVKLLLASTAQGLGKLEEAVGWSEKVSDAGGPSEGADLARTARALGATFLAWGRADAAAHNRGDEAALLRARGERLLAKEDRAKGTARVVLLWSHPALHPTLWSNALGTLMPAPEGDATLGIAQVMVPEREGAVIELRVEPSDLEHAARLGAEAVLTIVSGEGGPNEKIVRKAVSFTRDGRARLRFDLGGKEVQP
jgi:tetratricopeptide (TPR) repeat protein